MRLALALVATLLLLPLAASHHPYSCGCYCPTYDEEVDAGLVGVSVGGTPSGFGAILLKVDRYYIAEDYLYLNDVDHLGGFSLYFYEESNGVAGIQRGDEQCADTPLGMEHDTIIY